MLRTLISAAIASAALLGAAGVQAQPSGYYVATPAAVPAKARLMTRGTAWELRDGAYVAARAPQRDAMLCKLVARDVGQLSSFSARGKAFDADALGKCNAEAGPATAAAAN